MRQIVLLCLSVIVLCFAESCKNQYLTGYYSFEQFDTLCKWKQKVNLKYKPDPVYLDSLKTLNRPMNLKLFLGTWCSDSRRWVPRFRTIQSHLPILNVEIIAVDTTKKDSLRLYQVFKMDSIPLFVFLDANTNEEIGRMKVKPYKRKLEKTLYLNLKDKGRQN